MWILYVMVGAIVLGVVGFVYIRKMDRSPYVEISFRREGDDFAQIYRMPRLLWRTLVGGSVVFLLLVASTAFLSPLTTQALRTYQDSQLESYTETILATVRRSIDSTRVEMTALHTLVSSLDPVEAVVTDSSQLLTVAAVQRDVELARQTTVRVADIERELTSAKGQLNVLQLTVEGQRALMSEVLTQTRWVIAIVGLSGLGLLFTLAKIAFSSLAISRERPKSADRPTQAP